MGFNGNIGAQDLIEEARVHDSQRNRFVVPRWRWTRIPIYVWHWGLRLLSNCHEQVRQKLAAGLRKASARHGEWRKLLAQLLLRDRAILGFFRAAFKSQCKTYFRRNPKKTRLCLEGRSSGADRDWVSRDNDRRKVNLCDSMMIISYPN